VVRVSDDISWWALENGAAKFESLERDSVIVNE
jgi:hypothetical protein